MLKTRTRRTRARCSTARARSRSTSRSAGPTSSAARRRASSSSATPTSARSRCVLSLRARAPIPARDPAARRRADPACPRRRSDGRRASSSSASSRARATSRCGRRSSTRTSSTRTRRCVDAPPRPLGPLPLHLAHVVLARPQRYSGSTRTFASLLKTMVSKDVVGYASFIPRTTSKPQVVLLLPQVRLSRPLSDNFPSRCACVLTSAPRVAGREVERRRRPSRAAGHPPRPASLCRRHARARRRLDPDGHASLRYVCCIRISLAHQTLPPPAEADVLLHRCAQEKTTTRSPSSPRSTSARRSSRTCANPTTPTCSPTLVRARSRPFSPSDESAADEEASVLPARSAQLLLRGALLLIDLASTEDELY